MVNVFTNIYLTAAEQTTEQIYKNKDIFTRLITIITERFINPLQAILTNNAEILDYIIPVITLLMGLSLTYTIITFCKYVKTYALISKLKAKITGNIAEYDKIKREQIKAHLNEIRDIFSNKNKKIPFINNIYITISQTGIIENIPGFSEASFLSFTIGVAIFLFLIFAYTRSILIGLFVAAAFIIVIWYSLTLIAYNRKIKMELQLLQFVDACASASLQYASLVDIVGSIYEQFQSPFKDALENFYVECKSGVKEEIAAQRLKNKFNSDQLSFIIDTLRMCSAMTGNYHETAKDMAKTVSIYIESHEKKVSLLRAAKVQLTIMFFGCATMVFILNAFLGGVLELILKTTAGNFLAISFIVIYFYGLNTKAER